MTIRDDRRSFLFLFNVAKESNFGFMIRSANAFGLEPIVIGRPGYSVAGAAGQTRATPVHHFFKLADGVDFVRSLGCRVTGIEIMPEARPVSEDPFRGPTAFMVGNEGAGLLRSQQRWCDDFVYVPQYGNAVSLNVGVAAGIVLHRYAEWLGREESPREGHRFAATESPADVHAAHNARRNSDDWKRDRGGRGFA